MAFAVDGSLFDVEDERATGLEHSLELFGGGEKTLYVPVDWESVVSRRSLPIVGVWRRSNNEVNRLGGEASEDLGRVSKEKRVYNWGQGPAGRIRRQEKPFYYHG